MKTIMITGAAGFIGSHLSEALLELGYKVIGLDNFDPFYDRRIKEKNLCGLKNNPDFKFYEVDISLPYSLMAINDKFDVVIHLAAKAGVRPSIEDPEGYMKANLTGTGNLLNWMNSRGIKKFVFASSSSVYGNNAKVPFVEDDNVDYPISPYAYTKKSGELMNYTFHHLYKIDVANLRFFTVYGPRQRPDLAIHKFTKLIDQGRKISVYGKGDTYRDYTFIDDTVRGIIAATEYVLNHEKVYEIFNLGNSHPVSLMDLITLLSKLMGKEPKLEFLPMQPGDVDRTYASIDKANKEIGYLPSVGIEDGLSQFVNWYKSNAVSNF